jgi:hypothetical protein
MGLMGSDPICWKKGSGPDRLIGHQEEVSDQRAAHKAPRTTRASAAQAFTEE